MFPKRVSGQRCATEWEIKNMCQIIAEKLSFPLNTRKHPLPTDVVRLRVEDLAGCVYEIGAAQMMVLEEWITCAFGTRGPSFAQLIINAVTAAPNAHR